MLSRLEAAIDYTNTWQASAARQVSHDIGGSPENSKHEYITIMCPEGCGPGDMIVANFNGQDIPTQVPDGVVAGEEFEIQVETTRQA